MTDKKTHRIDSAELRRRAEELIGKQTATAHLIGTEQEPLRLHHELQVHQIELEMQNAELRQSRDELETALEKYTDLYDFAPVGYFTLDLNGTIRDVNLTGSTLVEFERARLVGRSFRHFVTEETLPDFIAFLGKVFTSPVKVSCEMTLLKKGKSPLYVQLEGRQVEAGQECRIALIDITERKRVEEALRQEKEAAVALLQAKEIAEATSKTKSQFIANMSHELRTPMSGILGMLQLALMENITPDTRDYLNTAQSSARSLMLIINDILDLAKIASGKFDIEKKPFSPRGCTAEAVDICTPIAHSKGLNFSVSVAKEVPDTVVGDNTRLRQVLINLIGNAVKFTEGGTVELRVTVGAATFDGKRELTFTVIDTGIGIPDDKKGLLFQAFSQVDPSYSRTFGGTGLGLVISRDIVELMGGTIGFASEEGVGSTFFFTIPLVEVRLESDAILADESRSNETIAPNPEGERTARLLLVEDDPVIRQVLGGMLGTNYYLDFAEDGLKAIEMWENGKYDLVLMDIQLPRLSGYEATRAIREKEQKRGGHTPIVAMTAHASREDEENCLAEGMDAFISKPIDFKMSLKVIEDIIKQNSCDV